MDDHVKDVVRRMTDASDHERIHFRDVVEALMAAGVERYHADLVGASKTYYMPDGSFEVTPCHPVKDAARAFSAAGVAAAVRGAQANVVQYREFCDRIADAGCIAYVVSLVGRRAVYYGRTGETHVELFPGT